MSARNADLYWAAQVWALFFQVVVEEARSVHRGGECGNFLSGSDVLNSSG